MVDEEGELSGEEDEDDDEDCDDEGQDVNLGGFIAGEEDPTQAATAGQGAGKGRGLILKSTPHLPSHPSCH